MRIALLVGLIAFLSAVGATAFEVDFSWRWQGLRSPSRESELVVRAAERFAMPPAGQTVRVDAGSGPMDGLRARVVVRHPRHSRRGDAVMAVYQAALQPSRDGIHEAAVAVAVPRGGHRIELELIQADGQVVRPREELESPFRDDGTHVNHLLVSRDGRKPNSADSSGCRPAAMPSSEAGLVPFERIQLGDVALTELGPQAQSALRDWVLHGGSLLLESEAFAESQGSPILTSLWPGQDAFTTQAGSAEAPVLSRPYGLGRVLVRKTPIHGVSSWIANDGELGAQPDRTYYDPRPKRWTPEGSLLRDRSGRYLLLLVPYVLAAAGTGLLLAMRRVDRFLRVAPALAIAFSLVYFLIFAAQRAEPWLHRTRVLVGQAGSLDTTARLFTSAYCSTQTRLALEEPGGGTLVPRELDLWRDGWSHRESEPAGPLVVQSGPKGWQVGFDLLPAQVRSFSRWTERLDIGTVTGGLAYDPEQRRWTGELVSRLELDLQEAHLVFGWHHQVLGPLAPGQTARIDIAAVSPWRHGGCKDCGQSHESGALCASCRSVHPISGAWRNILRGEEPEHGIARHCLQEMAVDWPEYFSQPLLIGVGRDRAATRDVVLMRVPIAALEKPAFIPGIAAARRWSVRTDEHGSRTKSHRCELAGQILYRGWIEGHQPIRFQYPYRGPVARLTIDLGPSLGNSSGGNLLVGVLNRRTGAYEDFLRKGAGKVVIEERAGDYFDPADGTVSVKVPQLGSGISQIDVDIEGGAR